MGALQCWSPEQDGQAEGLAGHNGERVGNWKKCKDKGNREELRLSGTSYSCVHREKRGKRKEGDVVEKKAPILFAEASICSSPPLFLPLTMGGDREKGE